VQTQPFESENVLGQQAGLETFLANINIEFSGRVWYISSHLRGRGVPCGTKKRPCFNGTLLGWCLQVETPPGLRTMPSKLPGTPFPIFQLILAG
jgi:hypothetical protein